ncbi:MAG: WGxxGxxG family protein [Coleofasciculaceae cyanobacterium]
MKYFNLSKLLGTIAIATSLTLLPLSIPAHAQVEDRTVEPEGVVIETEDDDFNWGWLGLLGLLGLAGLAGNKRKEVNHVETVNRDHDVAVPPSYPSNTSTANDPDISVRDNRPNSGYR